jgi:MFS family permease
VRVRERTATLTQAELDAVLAPRTVTVREVADGEHAFVDADAEPGAYRRTLTVEPAEDGRFVVHQRVEMQRNIDTGMWDRLIGPLLAGHLGRIGPDTKAPFWYPPDRLDARASSAMARLATVSFVLGYTTILLSQTITYAAEEFGASKGAQGVALATVRLEVIMALPLAFLADRRGRRWLAVNGTLAACLFSALGALAPNLIGLTGAQMLARGASNACIAVVAVMLAEEMPAGARAWATGLAAMAGALGGGICVFALPIADLSPGAWRALYLIPLLFIPVTLRAGRRLEETHRFAVHSAGRVSLGTTWALLKTHRARFALIAGSATLLSLFVAPASQFQNEFLRNDRGFSGAQITLFITLTSLPGSIGIFLGGRLAESGRRAVGAAATFISVALTVAQFWSFGALLYTYSALGSLFGAATVPSLGVYGPELFPTEARSAANGGIAFASRIGSVIGLVAAGFLSDRIGFTRTFTYLAAGPAILTVLILVAYPETAHHTLEELNPEDKAP